MTTPASQSDVAPTSARRLIKSIIWAAIGSAFVLVAIVLPAEFGVDPTGIGRTVGLLELSAPPSRALSPEDVVGGNDGYKTEAKVNLGDPTPLPNPAVVQVKPAVATTRTFTIQLGVDEKAEVKAILDKAQVILYSWQADGGEVYTDFHGHEPDSGRAFVRYEEQQAGRSGNGSLVAPFAGEHGWYWLNLSDNPVTIKLEVSGYFRDVVDYGILE